MRSRVLGAGMKVLVACEFSGIVRDVFLSHGHDAVSCDFLTSEKSGPHYKGDVRDIWSLDWDMIIAHPPCTFLTVSGNRWFTANPDRQREREAAIWFVKALMSLPAPKIALENPIGVLSTRFRKPDQIIQPWMFGHGEVKATCLWLKGLPLLEPSLIVDGREARVHRCPPSSDRWKQRSRTLQGVADAMGAQWG